MYNLYAVLILTPTAGYFLWPLTIDLFYSYLGPTKGKWHLGIIIKKYARKYKFGYVGKRP